MTTKKKPTAKKDVPKADPKALHDFVALEDGWVAGRRVKKGDPVQLTIAAAKYEPVAPADKAAAT